MLRRPRPWRRSTTQQRLVDRITLRAEHLEARYLLSGTSALDGIMVDSTVAAAAVTNSTVVGLTPMQIARAYGFNQISLPGGIVGTGAGQTIAIVDAYDDPNIVSDLHVFDQVIGLADPPSFSVVKQTVGGAGPKTDSGWAMEIALDVEWAHAMAPQANILLVEANNSSLNNLLSAVDYARNVAAVSVISMSWGSDEFLSETFYDSHFTTPAGHQGITFVASSGDSGAPSGWPAVSPNVMAVGGTTLGITASGYGSEAGWSGSGGGTSLYESRPAYQSNGQPVGHRDGPDVAYDADPASGFAVYDTVATGGRTGWFRVGGTSAGAPQWAALVAIADQGRVLAGRGTLANAQAAIYGLSAADFHDVLAGSNGYFARAGFDVVTGRGSPVANLVVRDLVNFGGSTAVSATSNLLGGSQFFSRSNAQGSDGFAPGGTSLGSDPWTMFAQGQLASLGSTSDRLAAAVWGTLILSQDASRITQLPPGTVREALTLVSSGQGTADEIESLTVAAVSNSREVAIGTDLSLRSLADGALHAALEPQGSLDEPGTLALSRRATAVDACYAECADAESAQAIVPSADAVVPAGTDAPGIGADWQAPSWLEPLALAGLVQMITGRPSNKATDIERSRVIARRRPA